MRTLLHVALACGAISQAIILMAAEPQSAKQERRAPSLRAGEIPIGRLGYPIGELLLVEGKRGEKGKGAPTYLFIEKLNGIALKKPLAIYVENLDLPKDTTCTLYGYESMSMVGDAPAYEQYAKLKGRPRGTQPQFGWGVWSSFWVVGVEGPASLEFPKKRSEVPLPTSPIP